MKKLVLLAVLLAGFAASPTLVTATPILITNPSFEDPLIGGFTSYIPGWDVSGSAYAGVWDPRTHPSGLTASDGNQVGFSWLGQVTQVLSDTLTANTTYTLSIDLGRRTDGRNVGDNYSISLLAGGTALASVTPVVPPSGGWQTLTATYTTTGSVLPGYLAILIWSSGDQLDFDNVKLDASPVGVPDGGVTIALLGLAMSAFAGARRKFGI